MDNLWPADVQALLLADNYQAIANFYEGLINADPEQVNYYYYLGLAYLLEGREEEAQTTWLSVLLFQEDPQELINILEGEAQRQLERGEWLLSWLIRSHLREIVPEYLDNLLALIPLDIKLEKFSPKKLYEWQVIPLIEGSETVNNSRLFSALTEVIEFAYQQSVDFVRVSFPRIVNKQELAQVLEGVAMRMAHQKRQPVYAAELMKLGLLYFPEDFYIINNLCWFYSKARKFEESLNFAEQFEEKSKTIDLRLYAYYLKLHALMQQGSWLEAQALIPEYKNLLNQLIAAPPEKLGPVVKDNLSFVHNLFYFEDNLPESRRLHQEIGKIFQDNYVKQNSWTISSPSYQHKKIRVGYIGHTLRKHCVGWLSRWLIHYHDREKFELGFYLVNQEEDEITEKWFKSKADRFYNFVVKSTDIARQIEKDEIDILVDLDSSTNAITFQVMALKPAPIQVNWLGYDSSGLPTMDYLIADPYILPENAQDYYGEKIWRLPHTYIAVDGFEVGVPTLRRDSLGIPDSATIYLNVQTGLKRHPEMIRLQMQIIKAVKDSYLLFQGFTDHENFKNLVLQIAEEEGIGADRLRFLPIFPVETYRANLGIADVVLDTYPFNGGTTTLDVLWMGIPLVTKVGEQWFARNGYSLLTNTGLSEGIAWSDGEYVEWGIRLGEDRQLRELIYGKLQRSRHSAPLWKGYEFTKEMEKAYQQMWELHCA
jgi:predicted O-linked N-acetylglucosamine transferase (SPINDLY family)